jgi:hypothetical protein
VIVYSGTPNSDFIRVQDTIYCIFADVALQLLKREGKNEDFVFYLDFASTHRSMQHDSAKTRVGEKRVKSLDPIHWRPPSAHAPPTPSAPSPSPTTTTRTQLGSSSRVRPQATASSKRRVGSARRRLLLGIRCDRTAQNNFVLSPNPVHVAIKQ